MSSQQLAGKRNWGILFGVLTGVLFGASATFVAALLARDVSAAPLLVLSAPVVNLCVVLGIGSPVVAALFGALLYGGYGAVIVKARRGMTRLAAAIGIILFHGANIAAMNLWPYLAFEFL